MEANSIYEISYKQVWKLVRVTKRSKRPPKIFENIFGKFTLFNCTQKCDLISFACRIIKGYQKVKEIHWSICPFSQNNMCKLYLNTKFHINWLKNKRSPEFNSMMLLNLHCELHPSTEFYISLLKNKQRSPKGQKGHQRSICIL